MAFRRHYFIIYTAIEITSLDHSSYFTNLRSCGETPTKDRRTNEILGAGHTPHEYRAI